ncbi:hypothetical protein NHX12_010798 [Muraenolepis orangiensis]|uniref:Uncharacterized protein n=1 Tax=Muraenolepis orangiensis TaxID=630683 RepID=A0A9Q0I6J8_9TELE|nr:hypothetical protein NHX12_010798 [Muraenolepis orangiensis]
MVPSRKRFWIPGLSPGLLVSPPGLLQNGIVRPGVPGRPRRGPAALLGLSPHAAPVLFKVLLGAPTRGSREETEEQTVRLEVDEL